MNRMGCGCDLGCECMDKGLGQSEKANALNPWWFAAGAGAGVGLWYFLKHATSPASVPGQEMVAPVPPIAPPSRFANLQSVALRLDQIKTLYRMDQMTVEQALAESNGLIQAANGFSLQEGARASEVVSAIQSFQAELQDFIQFKKDNPVITQRVSNPSVTVRLPVVD